MVSSRPRLQKKVEVEDTRLRAAATGRRRDPVEDTIGSGESAKDDDGQWAKGNGQEWNEERG